MSRLRGVSSTDHIEQLLSCSVCLETFDNEDLRPKLLPCHHSFCTQCLLRLADNTAYIHCPSCRDKVALPCTAPEGVHRLQTNFYISQMQDLFSDQQRGRVCRRHGLNLNLFCVTCEVTVCQECCGSEHQESGGHSVQELANAEDDQRRLLEMEVAEASHIIAVNSVHLKSLHSEQGNLFSSKDQAISRINSTFDRHAAVLEQRRQELISEARSQFVERGRVISDKIEALRQQMMSLHALCEQCHSAVTSAPIHDLLAYKAKIANKNREIRSDNRVNKHHELNNNYIKFREDEVGSALEEMLLDIGSLTVTDPLPSILKFQPGNGIAGLFVNMEITVQSQKGEPLENYPISAEIRDGSDDLISSVVHHMTSGQYQVTFRPQISGLHHLQVLFADRPMPNGSFTFNVASNDPVDCLGGEDTGQMEYPRAVASDHKNNLFVMDTGNCRIGCFDKSGNQIGSIKIPGRDNDITSCGVAVSGELVVCTEVSVHQSDLSTAHTLLLLSTTGQLLHRYDHQAHLSQALSVAINSAGHIITADSTLNSIFIFHQDGRLLTRFGSTGSTPGRLKHPMFVCMGENDDIIVSDRDNNRIQVFDKLGKFLYEFGQAGSGKGQFNMPFGVATDYHNNILVVDGGNRRIQVFKSGGEFVCCIESLGAPLQAPRGVAVTTDGHVVVADRDNHCVKKYKYLHCTSL